MTPEQWVEAQNKLVGLARVALRRFWGTLDLGNPVESRRRLEVFWPVLVNDYGEVAATLAADRFEDETGLRARLAAPIPADEANARLRWAMGPMFGGDGEDAAFALLYGLVDELVKRLGRDTYLDSIGAYGGRFARIPVGKTCAFCLMLASRGFDYVSRASAGEFRKFHPDCDCRIAVEGEDVGDYDPDALYDIYLDARGQADSGKTKSILAAMREQQGTN